MASPNISRQSNGFTLVEILITIAILAVIFSLGVFISLDFYKSFSSRSERDTIVSILQKARGQALANIDQLKHGVHFSTIPTQYILFEGDAYNPGNPGNSVFDAAAGVTIVGAPIDVIFDQLSGQSSPITISVQDQTGSHAISINAAGRIDW